MIIIEPFNFEGPRRKKEIEDLAGSLLEQIDMCLVFELDVLFSKERVTLAEALQVADSTVLYAIKAISDLLLGDQLKVIHSPTEGLRDVSNSEILSVLKNSGKTWAGYGSSYSIKSAVQRALFESPFLQHLVPGVKGIVLCTIVSSEDKSKKEIQTAVHALQCTIGPRAKLICTVSKEPNQKRGLTLATLLFTRFDGTGGPDYLKQYVASTGLPGPVSLFSDRFRGHSNSLNGREVRKASSEDPLQNADIKLIGPRQQSGEITVSNRVDDSLSDNDRSDAQVPNKSLHEDAGIQNITQDEIAGDTSIDSTTARKTVTAESASTLKIGLDFNDDFYPSGGPVQGVFLTDQKMSQDVISKNDVQETLSVAIDVNVLGVHEPEHEGQIDYYEAQADAFSEKETTFGEANGSWKFPSLSTVILGSKDNTMKVRKSLLRWQSGPYSAAAEAWAQTRQQLGNLGSFEREKFNKLPIGVKSTSDLEGVAVPFGREEGREREGVSQSTLFSFTEPLGRVLTSSLEVVADIYTAASAKIFRKDEGEEVGQAPSYLSERAASMLETERSSNKLPPMVEMRYKNGIYRGRCNGGLPEGKGRLSYEDGSFYYGFWKRGKRAGFGSFYYANGDVFQGYWRDDQKHGKGWFYFHSGDRLYADFWKGKANGEGRYYSAKGDVFFGHFKESWRHGEALSIESGARWSEVWDHGILISRSRIEGVDQN
ncbi:hypothetical protein KP509_19G031600 [Ceratopteris richardii]|nr:hypothetical protein KP509_19G031600 [Ceratopteris richardii]